MFWETELKQRLCCLRAPEAALGIDFAVFLVLSFQVKL